MYRYRENKFRKVAEKRKTIRGPEIGNDNIKSARVTRLHGEIEETTNGVRFKRKVDKEKEIKENHRRTFSFLVRSMMNDELRDRRSRLRNDTE